MMGNVDNILTKHRRLGKKNSQWWKYKFIFHIEFSRKLSPYFRQDQYLHSNSRAFSMTGKSFLRIIVVNKQIT